MAQRIRIGFVIEYAIGHVTFANMLEEAVANDPSVEAEWFLMRSGPEDWIDRVPPFDRNYTLQISMRTRRQLGRRQDHLDAVLIHTQTAALLSWRLMDRLPIVISTDGTPRNIDDLSAAYRHAVHPPFLESVKRRLIGGMLRRAAMVMPWSEWAASSLIEDYGVLQDRIRLIRPGVYPENWLPKSDYGRDGQARFLFVGGNFQRKGGDTLLQALDEMDGDWRLDVVTNTVLPDHPRIQVFNGITPGDPRLAEIYGGADVFVLPTDGDTYGWAILEAMAAALPIVSTTVGAIPEIVHDGRTGFLVHPGDAKGLRASLEKLMDSAGLRSEFGQESHRQFLEEHNAHANMRSVLELVKSVATSQN